MRAAHHKSQQPYDEHDNGHPPQKVESESHAEKQQREQKNNEQRSHDYQPPRSRMPANGTLTRNSAGIIPAGCRPTVR
jgi:hypothetical protein